MKNYYVQEIRVFKLSYKHIYLYCVAYKMLIILLRLQSKTDSILPLL